MTKEKLHQLRLFIPGFLLILVVVFLFKPDVDMTTVFQQEISKNSVLYFIGMAATIIFGVAYYLMDFRMYVMKTPLSTVRENIKTKLLSSLNTKDQSLVLKNNVNLMVIFYDFVDHDNSLIEQKKEVYLNGIVWSTLADIRIISIFALILYSIAWFFTDIQDYLILIGATISFIFLTLIFLPVATKKHLNLSNNQLDVILQNHKEELQKKLLNALKQANKK